MRPFSRRPSLTLNKVKCLLAARCWPCLLYLSSFNVASALLFWSERSRWVSEKFSADTESTQDVLCKSREQRYKSGLNNKLHSWAESHRDVLMTLWPVNKDFISMWHLCPALGFYILFCFLSYAAAHMITCEAIFMCSQCNMSAALKASCRRFTLRSGRKDSRITW